MADSLENEEVFLARWANEELSEEEIQKFKENKDYDLFKSIINGAEHLEIDEERSDDLYSNILMGIDKTRLGRKRKSKWWYAAACIALVLGTIFMNYKTTTHRTNYGQQTVVYLPDSSKATPNSNSTIEFKKSGWMKSRELTLSGEAFFEVKPGSSFTVDTEYGTVRVLGTSFTVNAYDNFLEVLCYHGKVGIKNKEFDNYIIKGNALRLDNGEIEKWDFQDKYPSWLKGESSFKNAHIKQVIRALENQYNITFDSKSINTKLRFTGSFPNSDLSLALKVVFEPLRIKVIFVNDYSIRLLPYD